MIQTKKILYAIFKNNTHKGNQTGINREDAIKNYIIESMLEDFVDDKKFLKQYKATPAINGVHHHFIATKEMLN